LRPKKQSSDGTVPLFLEGRETSGKKSQIAETNQNKKNITQQNGNLLIKNNKVRRCKKGENIEAKSCSVCLGVLMSGGRRWSFFPTRNRAGKTGFMKQAAGGTITLQALPLLGSAPLVTKDCRRSCGGLPLQEKTADSYAEQQR